MTATRPRRQTHMRHPADRDRRANPVNQLEQSVRPRGETVVHLAAEPAKFTLVTTAGLHNTTNNGHLILPEKIRLSSQSDQVAAPCQSLNRATEPSPDVKREAQIGESLAAAPKRAASRRADRIASGCAA
jgi:hypothetical protein